MSVEANVQFDIETVNRISQEGQEPEWVNQLRADGLNGYEQLPLPKLEKTKIDKWNIDRLVPYKKEEAVNTLEKLPEEIKQLLDEANKNVIIQKHSSVIYSGLSDSLKQQGVLFMPLAQAVREQETLVKKYLFQSGVEQHKVTALHQALWNGGVFVYVPRNVEITEPLQIVLWAAEEEVALLPHIIVAAGVNSSVTIVENVAGIQHEKPVVMNSMVELFAEDGARISYSSLRNQSANVTDYTHRRAIAAKDARIEWLLGEMNSGNTVSNTTTVLDGDGSNASLKSVAIGTGTQKENFMARVLHKGKSTDSDILVRGVMLDESTAIFNGLTEMKKGCEKANGQQAENILMIGDRARGDANPMLLIDEDDVMAGHAASVGPVNPEQVYYLMSRGISRRQAERLVIIGFLSPVLDQLPIEGVQKRLLAITEGKLS
ncbi:Fe-S cluster assembly protein SufD [Aneurinibacillus sp. Ricciae_BoGa-3]|uniref:Fe-S cluster assembly protein SufD n=1 Tax=Aneurinibacillus sp. Ricciae_BoGa-3 TaxID=3022697 RepID=UPI002341F042|nr:Fe-S cluster assembly protein SufD [Aneurinibacillus sp. Ricciae_BoGa-3]WCK53943.1 Fe-S cluster assembly protein SufD [Aneurinibacillus sp. Ricciae_BoGa-3]